MMHIKYLAVCLLLVLAPGVAEANGASGQTGHLWGETVFQMVGKAEVAPNMTIELRHQKRIFLIHSDEYGTYNSDLEPGRYFVVRALDSDGKEIEFLRDQPRCALVRSDRNQVFDFMLKPPTNSTDTQRDDYSGCDCEADDYGFLQGNVEWRSAGSYVIAPGVTVELKGEKTIRFRTDEYGEYLQKLKPGKYRILRVQDQNGVELVLFPGSDRCVNVRKMDCITFYIELKKE